MTINFDNALGPHPDALAWRAARTRIIASNLANADTPGYQARDLDFKAIMKAAGASGADRLQLERREPGHLGSPAPRRPDVAEFTYWRVPTHPSIDGNTVDTQAEQASFARNALQFQAALTFLSGRLRGLVNAFRGE